MNWKPVELSEVEIADYRPAAAVIGNIFDIGKFIGAQVCNFEEDGLGPAHAIFLKNGVSNKFCLILSRNHLRDGNYMEIDLKNQENLPQVSLSHQDLNEIILYIGVSSEAIDWISEFVEKI